MDSEWETMAAEIAEDVRQGKMEGPYRGPSHWPKNIVNLPDFERTSRLLDLPTRQRACSLAFAVRQTGSDGKPKIRRAQDTYHSIDALVQLARALRTVAPRDQLQTWGLDPENAYRQLPAADPCHACVILPTQHGIALWRRRALLFGLTASVWSYCRTANLASWFGREIYLLPALRFVDDFGATRSSARPTAASRSARSQVIQGVKITVDLDSATVAPTPERVQRFSAQLYVSEALWRTATSRSSLVSWRTTVPLPILVWQIGAAALRPLRKRAAATDKRSQTGAYGVSPAIDAATQWTLQRLKGARPRQYHSTSTTWR